MADPAALKLPAELLIQIIKSTSDEESIRMWCAATEGSALLHKTALSSRWTWVADGSDAERSLHSLEKHEIEIVAPLIRHLVLDLSKELLSPEALFSTLARLETLAIKKKFSRAPLKYFRSLPQSQVLRTLAIPVRPSGRDYDDSLNGNSGLGTYVFWPNLLPVNGDELEALEVNELFNDNRRGLLFFISRQRCLKTLRLEVGHRLLNSEDFLDRGESPLTELLDQSSAIMSPDYIWRLSNRVPKSLKSLTIVDSYFLGQECASIESAKVEEPLSAAKLDELTLEIDNPSLILNLLSWFPQARLLRLRLPAASRVEPQCFPRPIDKARILNAISEVVSTHQDTLEEVTLSNIWHAHKDLISDFNDYWIGKFAVTDLVLACREPISYQEDLWPRDRPYTTLFHEIFGYFYSPLTPRQRWGTKLQRLRVEALALALASPDCLSDVALASLRILILCPFRSSQEAHYPLDVSSFEEGLSAQEIARFAPRSLRYLAIGPDRFWIHRPEDIKNQSSAQQPGGTNTEQIEYLMLHFRHARDGGWSSGGNEEEESALRHYVHKWMSDEDRDFINEDSRLNRNRSVMPDKPPYPLVQQWNFAIARRVS